MYHKDEGKRGSPNVIVGSSKLFKSSTILVTGKNE